MININALYPACFVRTTKFFLLQISGVYLNYEVLEFLSFGKASLFLYIFLWPCDL